MAYPLTERVDGFLEMASGLFDPMHVLWEKELTQRVVSGVLVLVFLATLGVIQLNRQGYLPEVLAAIIPLSHYWAISLAFTCVLILEVVSLIFALPCSISKALGKQFEILALIFLRNSFKELVLLPEPITIFGHFDVLWRLLADGGGAIVIFGLLGLYSKMLRSHEESTLSSLTLFRFVAAKKLVSFCLVFLFFGMGVYNGWLLVSGGEVFQFFQSFYTILIFSDILLVLIAQCFLPEFQAVFRNSGYALATLLIRLALTAPPFYNVMIGIVSALLAIFLTGIYNKFYLVRDRREGRSGVKIARGQN